MAMLVAFRLGLYPKSISISMAQTSIILPSRLNGAIWRKYVLHFLLSWVVLILEKFLMFTKRNDLIKNLANQSGKIHNVRFHKGDRVTWGKGG